MKTLIIHPSDRSTDFLKAIYEGKNYEVINDIRNKKYLRERIKENDKIIMMGHGTPNGLIAMHNGRCYGFAIDDSFADLLRAKETISIWCWSDEYFKRNAIKGFHTGMIISEVSEALWAVKEKFTKEFVLDNMNRFAKVVGECIEEEPKVMQKYILDNYVGEDSITKFNRGNIIVLD